MRWFEDVKTAWGLGMLKLFLPVSCDHKQKRSSVHLGDTKLPLQLCYEDEGFFKLLGPYLTPPEVGEGLSGSVGGSMQHAYNVMMSPESVVITSVMSYGLLWFFGKFYSKLPSNHSFVPKLEHLDVMLLK